MKIYSVAWTKLKKIEYTANNILLFYSILFYTWPIQISSTSTHETRKEQSKFEIKGYGKRSNKSL